MPSQETRKKEKVSVDFYNVLALDLPQSHHPHRTSPREQESERKAVHAGAMPRGLSTLKQECQEHSNTSETKKTQLTPSRSFSAFPNLIFYSFVN